MTGATRGFSWPLSGLLNNCSPSGKAGVILTRYLFIIQFLLFLEPPHMPAPAIPAGAWRFMGAAPIPGRGAPTLGGRP